MSAYKNGPQKLRAVCKFWEFDALPAGSTKESRKRKKKHFLPAAETAAAASATVAATTATAVSAAASTLAATEAAAASTTASTAWATLTAGTATGHNRLRWQQAFALQLLAGQLAGATHRLSLLAGLLFRRLFEMTAEFHLAENAFALQLFLQRFESLIDIVVADENLQAVVSSNEMVDVEAIKTRARGLRPQASALILKRRISKAGQVGNAGCPFTPSSAEMGQGAISPHRLQLIDHAFQHFQPLAPEVRVAGVEAEWGQQLGMVL